MKDLAHHIKKLNRRVIRSAHREEIAEEEFDLAGEVREQTVHQKKKQAKERIKQAKIAQTPHPLTPEQRNRKMKRRAPIFDRNKAKPRIAKRTKKKTPRI